MVKRSRIVVFGDVIDDIVAVPQTTVRTDTDTATVIRHRAGGSAANVAAWLGYLGSSVDFVGRVGAEDVQRHTQYLGDFGVNALLTGDRMLPTGTIIVVVDGEQRTMLTDRGANARLDPDQITDAMLDAARVLHLTGHSICVEAVPGSMKKLIARAGAHGAQVSVDPGSAGFIADFGVEKFLDVIDGADLLFPNLDEGRLLSGRSEPLAVVESLVARFPLVALTMGIDGVIAARRGSAPITSDVVPVRAVDPTGAGDAFTAGFLASWVRSGQLPAASISGARIAAQAVTVIGARPAA